MRDILGPYLTDRGRLEEADAVYRELFASQDLPPWPHDLAMAHYNQARVHEKLGRMAEAEAGYREAIRLDAAYAKPRNNLATLLADAGRATDAIAEYESLLALPLDAASRSKYAFNLGTVLADERRWRDAEDRFRQAVDADPRSAEALEWLGIVLLKQGRAAESLDCLQRALSLARDPATATRIRGNLAIATRLSKTSQTTP
jgi:tetratricopeptide (TPR) repeat protein